MYDSSLAYPTNISLSTNQTKKPDRLNRGTSTGLFLSLRSCWSGAGSKKRPERGGGGHFFTLKSLGVRLKKTVLDGRPSKAEDDVFSPFFLKKPLPLYKHLSNATIDFGHR
jgi:hypothetical protein